MPSTATTGSTPLTAGQTLVVVCSTSGVQDNRAVLEISGTFAVLQGRIEGTNDPNQAATSWSRITPLIQSGPSWDSGLYLTAADNAAARWTVVANTTPSLPLSLRFNVVGLVSGAVAARWLTFYDPSSLPIPAGSLVDPVTGAPITPATASQDGLAPAKAPETAIGLLNGAGFLDRWRADPTQTGYALVVDRGVLDRVDQMLQELKRIRRLLGQQVGDFGEMNG